MKTDQIKEIKRIQLTALDRIGMALNELGRLTDATKIEEQLNFIRELATGSFRQAHIANAAPGEWHDPACMVINAAEFPEVK